MGETRVLVASQNEVKAEATKSAFETFLGHEAIVMLSTQKINSGVSDQPLSLEETALGALNRIASIKKEQGYAYYVAIEGGTYKVEIGSKTHWFESACAVIQKHDTDPSIAYGPAYPVPDNLAGHIEKGLDLNQAMELETGIKEIGSSVGFNGWLTDNQIDRKTASAEAVLMALHGLNHA